jgi:AcrR family transcriptional regulator
MLAGMSPDRSRAIRRTGVDTRSEAQRVALSLFSSQGYDATSMQQIADALGIKKASLYYHFAGKEDILRSLLTGRSDEARELAQWVRAQPPSRNLAREAVLRWIDSFSVDKLRGIRFMNANPRLFRSIAAGTGVDVGDDLQAVLDGLLPAGASAARVLLLRMAFMSISTAVAAAEDLPDVDEAQTIAAARACAVALIDRAMVEPL